jgi:hypothetical protein
MLFGTCTRILLECITCPAGLLLLIIGTSFAEVPRNKARGVVYSSKNNSDLALSEQASNVSYPVINFTQ